MLCRRWPCGRSPTQEAGQGPRQEPAVVRKAQCPRLRPTEELEVYSEGLDGFSERNEIKSYLCQEDNWGAVERG